MGYLNHVILLVTFTLVFCENDSLSESFKECKLVPELIPVAPDELAKVKYANVNVSAGEELAPSEAVKEPHVTWDADNDGLYTLVMLDSDARSQDNNDTSPYNHWLVVDIPGDALGEGEVLAEYCPPTPPQFSGLHRYSFLVYEQEAYLDTDKLKHSYSDSRAKFPLLDFAKKHELGDPVAGNFFRAQDEMFQTLNI